jgi:hypothetical protein
MTDFPKLQAMLPEIEAAEALFDMRTSRTYDEAKIATATAALNQVLARAAAAMVEDLGKESMAASHQDEWRPKRPGDTWFGLEPVKFLRRVVRDGLVARPGLPDETGLH